MQTDQMRLYQRACKTSRPDESLSLIRRLGSKIDAKSRISPGDTALIASVRNNDIDSFRRLLKFGASLTARNSNGDSALELATEKGGEFFDTIKARSESFSKRRKQGVKQEEKLDEVATESFGTVQNEELEDTDPANATTKTRGRKRKTVEIKPEAKSEVETVAAIVPIDTLSKLAQQQQQQQQSEVASKTRTRANGEKALNDAKAILAAAALAPITSSKRKRL
jgi:hypothetical protein